MADRPTTGWLKGFHRIDGLGIPGTFNGAPKRFVAHTTQGLSRYPVDAARRHLNPPHLWVCPPSHPYAPRTKIQLYSLDVAARALHHPPGTPETNKMGAIQVEIEGFAEKAAMWSVEDLEWLADEVFGPACEYAGVDVEVFIQGDPDVADTYGKRAKSRMTAEQWRVFDGLCTHQNVPDNEHWDAGGLDLAFISDRLIGAPTPAPGPDKKVRIMDLDTVTLPANHPDLPGCGVEYTVVAGKVFVRWQTAPGQKWTDAPVPLPDVKAELPVGVNSINARIAEGGEVVLTVWNDQSVNETYWCWQEAPGGAYVDWTRI